MSLSLDTNSPLPYGDWLQYHDAINPKNAQSDYLLYLNNWYKNKNSKSQNNSLSIKEQYVQLAKDLSYLFASDESVDPFLKNIDFTNDEDIIYAIPFFAKKLKQIAIVLKNKRQSVKKSKLKYNLIGSNDGLEKLLYDYVLKGFTNTENSITQVPASPLLNYFPDLSAVKNNFFIEIEELHDTNSYFDSDPTVSIENYLNHNEIDDLTPLDGLTDDEITHIISTRFLPRVAETPLSNIFKAYVTSLPSLSTVSLSSNAYNLTYNEINASKKYLGEPVYGLTAVRLKETNKPDVAFSLNLQQGNNWFYWPSGNFVLNDSIYNNTFSPITLNNSNLINSNATAGSDYTTSDLIFTDKNGIVEGAWLRGPYYVTTVENAKITINGSDTKNFIYPFAGIEIDSKSLNFSNYSIDDTNNYIIDNFPSTVKAQILKDYYTSKLPLITANPIYLNQTELINLGSHASEFSTEADNVIKLKKSFYFSPTYSENIDGPIDQAYLYKFQKTDIPINVGINQIHWPIYKYTSTDNSPITIKNDFCSDISLSDINPLYTMAGAIAGTTFSNSDVIYKYTMRDGDPIEAAWLGSGSVSNLDINHNSIPVYSTPATKCAQPIEGPVQNTLSFVANGSDKISFVWMDADTPADNVFKYINHLPTCPYGKSMPHNFYQDQDYQNPSPINSINSWSSCICKSVNYSPIGHSGNLVTDYNGMADYLFADPDGVGVDFTLNGWSDTRGFDVNNSPQFSFYHITGGDNQVGYGSGTWKTGTGDRMILKTGRRYTYYRTSLRNSTVGNAPYFVTNYKYKNITGLYTSTDSFNLVIALDASKSQTNSIQNTKKIASSVIRKILSSNKNVKISVIIFGSNASRLSYLTNDYSTLSLLVDNLDAYPSNDNSQTNIFSALQLANKILTTTVSTGGYTSSISSLCSNLNYTLVQGTVNALSLLNKPNGLPSKILIFSDGVETIANGLGSAEATLLKNSNIEIYGVNSGELSYSNNLIETISSDLNHYFDLQNYLISGDGDINSFIEYIISKLGNTKPIIPKWYKAIRDNLGNWVTTDQDSDLVLRSGDYISYVHRESIYYSSPINSNTNFILNNISFTINIKLDGWDYSSATFDLNNIGENYGGKPFWAKVYTSPDSNNNWYKGTNAFGGQVRFFNDYTPIHQPEISSLILQSGDNIKYTRNIDKKLIWQQPLTLNTLISTYQWNKLSFKEDFSNLADFISINKYDGIVSDTGIISDITLEGYSAFKPAYYNYYARNSFNYTENLYYLNRCLNSFVTYNTGAIVVPNEPYANLDNVHYPTVATVSFPSQAVSNRQVGEYLLPEKLGTPYFRGKGYTIALDDNSLSYIDSISAERIYLDLEKYGPRNRGLTKKDQISPTKITNISNSWFVEPYSSGTKSGMIVDTLENQKLTPYQSSYEIYGKNYYGLARQDDIFEFWTPTIGGVWNDESQYPLDFKKQLPALEYTERKKALLANKGNMPNWRTDIYGTDYGIYKQFSPSDIWGLKMWFSADYGTLTSLSNDPFVPDTLADTINNQNVIKWIDKSGKFNNLIVSVGQPKLIKDPKLNNKLSILFDGSSNFYNDLNINTSNATLFIVGNYNNNSQSQVLAAFGNVSASNVNSINNGVLVFSKNSTFDFMFGSSLGVTLPDSSNVNQVTLSSTNISNNISKYYLFESVFSQPNIKTYITGNLYADTYNTFPNYSFDTALYSIGSFWVGSYVKNSILSNCSIAEIIYYEKALTDDERKQVENYLITKYGLS